MKTVVVFLAYTANIDFSLDAFCAYIVILQKAFMFD